jgi:hypothetical protein
VALPRKPCPIRFAFWVDEQDDFCHFLPVCPVCVGVEQVQIGDEMLLVVAVKFLSLRFSDRPPESER